MSHSIYGVAKFRRSMLHLIAGRAAQALCRMVLLLVVVRLLSAEDFGAYMLAVGVSEMLLQTFSLGILPVGQRFLPQLVDTAKPSDLRRFLRGISTLQFAILLLVTSAIWYYWDTLLPLVGFDAEQTERSRPAVWMLLFVPAFRFVADLLEALLEQGKAQAARALMLLGRLAGIGVLLLVGTEIGLVEILYIDGGITVICLIVAWLFMAGTLRGIAPPSEPKPLPVRTMMRHAWHMASVDFLGSASAPGAIRVAIASALSLSDSGLFAFLQSMQRLVGRYLPSVLLRGLVRPMLIARVHKKNGPKLIETVTGLLLKLNLLIIVAGVVVVYFAGDWIVNVASGGRFPQSGETLLLMVALLGITSQRLVLEMLLQIMNQTYVLRATAILAPLALALVWLVADYGLNVAVVVSASGVALANVICIVQLRRITGQFSSDWRGNAYIMMAAATAVVLGYFVQAPFGMWAGMATAGVLLVLFLAAVKPFRLSELRLIDRGVGSFTTRILTPFARMAMP